MSAVPDAEQGGELERFTPQGELDQRHVDQLALVGLSPAFPDRVLELNEGLNWLSEGGSFRGFRFSLNPDEKYPKVDVEARYTSPYNVVVEADVDGRASLTIGPKWGNKSKGSAQLGYLRLDQLREFTDGYPTGETILLKATHIPDSYSKGTTPELTETPPEEDIDDITVPLEEIDSAADLEELGITPIHFKLDIGFVGSAASLAIAMRYLPEPRVEEPVFTLHEFKAEDKPETIEIVTGQLGQLLKKHFMRRGED